MSSEPPNKIGREERIPFSTHLRFEADHKDVTLEGWTKNVSMTGAFVETTEVCPQLQQGDEGVVFVEMDKDGQVFQVSFPCVVARLIPGQGIGFDFESEEEEEGEEGEKEEIP